MPDPGGVSTSPHGIECVLELNHDADRGEHQGAHANHGGEDSLTRLVCSFEHRVDGLRAAVAE
jgi:hypothetical protein